ncbi:MULTISPECIES: methylglyoxal synthase [Clostridium]|jgi:methylglyoxal synthase|uniref:Methylglyoxal synthase n=3 Tax=Clostridium TaxID=1485 RepID=D8GNV4_CLOLD|nr:MULTISPECIES: methylglyoxal synthase [Clostridium]ADK13800.1 methylglyoxal synthase [Clostridium ljungdahlii DSM 13528]AGY77029.1 methylglyoxal synthase [Clostridium autoethanogenum DSM 10061]ALU37171.1 Methylglyoxal synthase [Clostridium autoethanogenum DSM 10061]OAA85048.1 Methylglyoxal synthase [Clostridium ljungdahlii DSM 13528]OAA91533.1 Methylglyoxal synthase [Clostridium coskatii]
MRIAFIAHDKKKDDIVDFVKRYKDVFEGHEIFATGTTGKLINEMTGLKVNRFLSGPLGGDQEIGSKVAQGEMDIVIFLRDPLTSQPHEPDIAALLRICDVHCVPLATNLGSAEVFVKALKSHN